MTDHLLDRSSSEQVDDRIVEFWNRHSCRQLVITTCTVRLREEQSSCFVGAEQIGRILTALDSLRLEDPGRSAREVCQSQRQSTLPSQYGPALSAVAAASAAASGSSAGNAVVTDSRHEAQAAS